MIALGEFPCSGNLPLHCKLLCGLLCCHALELGVLLIQQVRNLHKGQEFASQMEGPLSNQDLTWLISPR